MRPVRLATTSTDDLVAVHGAVAALADAREVLRLLPTVVTDVDADTYRGAACVSPEAAAQALSVWGDQLTALLPEPADRGERLSWQRARDRGRDVVCQHDQRQPVPTLHLETGRSTVVR
ncbi:hypothetical protein ADK70_26910 [Streptomyces rimosus subsp. pseudoverticillatus]|uniref:hypothetical protein n=1 Tax=Streptomyces rimosus TaxID=1927 RepID=UPI0006B25ED7|nr:hypothetical protein [Streptomyces rimosus]KOT80893.1 hypothetical protein ADK70_26910 [Streptomyces rimosus subsp. pseudoverticillatus]